MSPQIRRLRQGCSACDAAEQALDALLGRLVDRLDGLKRQGGPQRRNAALPVASYLPSQISSVRVGMVTHLRLASHAGRSALDYISLSDDDDIPQECEVIRRTRFCVIVMPYDRRCIIPRFPTALAGPSL